MAVQVATHSQMSTGESFSQTQQPDYRVTATQLQARQPASETTYPAGEVGTVGHGTADLTATLAHHFPPSSDAGESSSTPNRDYSSDLPSSWRSNLFPYDAVLAPEQIAVQANSPAVPIEGPVVEAEPVREVQVAARMDEEKTEGGEEDTGHMEGGGDGDRDSNIPSQEVAPPLPRWKTSSSSITDVTEADQLDHTTDELAGERSDGVMGDEISSPTNTPPPMVQGSSTRTRAGAAVAVTVDTSNPNKVSTPPRASNERGITTFSPVKPIPTGTLPLRISTSSNGLLQPVGQLSPVQSGYVGRNRRTPKKPVKPVSPVAMESFGDVQARAPREKGYAAFKKLFSVEVPQGAVAGPSRASGRSAVQREEDIQADVVGLNEGHVSASQDEPFGDIINWEGEAVRGGADTQETDVARGTNGTDIGGSKWAGNGDAVHDDPHIQDEIETPSAQLPEGSNLPQGISSTRPLEEMKNRTESVEKSLPPSSESSAPPPGRKRFAQLTSSQGSDDGDQQDMIHTHAFSSQYESIGGSSRSIPSNDDAFTATQSVPQVPISSPIASDRGDDLFPPGEGPSPVRALEPTQPVTEDERSVPVDLINQPQTNSDDARAVRVRRSLPTSRQRSAANSAFLSKAAPTVQSVAGPSGISLVGGVGGGADLGVATQNPLEATYIDPPSQVVSEPLARVVVPPETIGTPPAAAPQTLPAGHYTYVDTYIDTQPVPTASPPVSPKRHSPPILEPTFVDITQRSLPGPVQKPTPKRLYGGRKARVQDGQVPQATEIEIEEPALESPSPGPSRVVNGRGKRKMIIETSPIDGPPEQAELDATTSASPAASISRARSRSSRDPEHNAELQSIMPDPAETADHARDSPSPARSRVTNGRGKRRMIIETSPIDDSPSQAETNTIRSASPAAASTSKARDRGAYRTEPNADLQDPPTSQPIAPAPSRMPPPPVPAANGKATRSGRYSKRRDRDSSASAQSGSSGTSPSPDPLDESFHPVIKGARQSNGPVIPSSREAVPPAAVTSKVQHRKRNRVDDEEEEERDRVEERTSGSSSSPSPDPADETYRPLKGKGKGLKTKPTVELPSVKRIKTKAAVNSSRSSTTRGSSMTSAPPEPAPVPLVLGAWGPNWYPARVVGMSGTKYNILFEDRDTSTVSIDRLRLLQLRNGDFIKSLGEDSNNEYVVQEPWSGEDRGVKVTLNGKAHGRIKLDKLFLRRAVIKDLFEDRVPAPGQLGITPAGSAQSRSTSFTSSATSPTKPPAAPSKGGKKEKQKDIQPTSAPLAGKTFLITSQTSNKDDQQVLARLITKNGGVFLDDWEKLFHLPASKFKVADTVPFLLLLGDKALVTPKYLSCLAKGIPCLSAKFIDAYLADRETDWRSYVVEAGYSDILEQNCSQMLDPNWGGDDWDVSEAQAVRRPFSGKTFLFIDSKKRSDIKTLVTFCLDAMGAHSVDARIEVTPTTALAYDYIVVEDRNGTGKISKRVLEHERVCNVQWLKQCIIMGAALPPSRFQVDI